MRYQFIILALLITVFSFSQTEKEIEKIIENYDLNKIEKLSKELTEIYKADKKEAIRLAEKNNWPLIIKSDSSYKELMRVENGYPIYYTIHNSIAAKSTRAHTLHNGGLLGLNLEGQNMTAYVWDAGIARATHQEYDGIGGDNRFTSGDGNVPTHFHAAHVTGTIIASGVAATAKGMAPQASAIGYYWDNDIAEVSTATANGMLLSNHSYGLPITIPSWKMGAYNSGARSFDQIMYNAPYYLLVCAAGNDGQDSTSNTDPLEGQSSYDKLTGDHTTAKNSLVVANANDAIIDVTDAHLISVSINPTSSQGPTDDLRVKPDITGNGTQLYSTYDGSDSDYNSISGTSMASPNVMGTLLLLQQYYNNLNGNYMKAATLKGLTLHTADDLLGPGPDSEYGWGLLNAKMAAEVISNNGVGSIIQELTLNQGETYTVDVQSDDVNSLLASISWTDPAGIAVTGTINSPTPVLVNDLDIRITQSSNTYLPYKLLSVNTNGLGDNIVDPYERIDVNNPTGTYTITVTHKGTLSSGQQNFSLIVSGVQYSAGCTAIIPTNIIASDIVFFTSNVTWDVVLNATYEVRYRELYTTTWTTFTTTSSSKAISGLDASKTYEIQVRSICTNDNSTSDYSSSIQVGAAAGVKDYLYDFIIYPNPVKDILTIEGVDIITNVTLFSLLGQKVLEASPNKATMKLDMSNLNNGTYFAKITINGASQTIKIIK